MINKFVLAVLLLFTVLVIAFDVRSSVLVVASPSIIRVPDDYPTIQEAVNAANLRDTIFASAGTYYEHVTVNKTVSLIGDNPETTVIDGNDTGARALLYVTANNVKISRLTIQNGGYGIILDSCNGSTIYGNMIASNIDGVWLNRSSGNMITNNQILNNGYTEHPLWVGTGITLGYSNANIISNNSISNNIVGAVLIASSYNNIVNHNTLTNNPEAVGLSSSAGNIVSDNIVTSNEYGIGLWGGSTNNMIRRNQVFKNGGGVGVGGSGMNVIKENNITENEGSGIAICDIAPNNLIFGNTVSKNKYGIKIHYSDGSIIHHNNFINNTRNAPEDVYPNVNIWDDGYPSGGNYWSDYNGTDSDSGPYQNIAGNDGIGDTPHTLDTRNNDSFPLMAPISFFDAGGWNETSRNIYVSSNSTISNFQLNKTDRIVSFNVASQDYTVGFCRVTIPNIIIQNMWQDNYTVLVDGETPLDIRNWTDNTNTYMYFTYLHSEHEVVVIPEFPVATILPLFVIITLCAAVLKKKIKP